MINSFFLIKYNSQDENSFMELIALTRTYKEKSQFIFQ